MTTLSTLQQYDDAEAVIEANLEKNAEVIAEAAPGSAAYKQAETNSDDLQDQNDKLIAAALGELNKQAGDAGTIGKLNSQIAQAKAATSQIANATKQINQLTGIVGQVTQIVTDLTGLVKL
jgi:hypothetical protein